MNGLMRAELEKIVLSSRRTKTNRSRSTEQYMDSSCFLRNSSMASLWILEAFSRKVSKVSCLDGMMFMGSLLCFLDE